MKVGDLIEVDVLDKQGREELAFGVVIEDCPPESHMHGMHLVQVLHPGFTKWWPASYVRKIDEVRD